MKLIAPFRGAFALVALLAALVAGAEPSSAQKAKPAPARLAPVEIPAGRDGSAILTTPAPGRYSIRVKSPSGARIELVDMIAGPTDSSGAPGLRDGRIDALLDKGSYKIRVANAKGSGETGASGKAALSAEPFVEMDGKTPALVAGQTQGGELGDLRQRTYALEVGPEGRVAIEAEGRALADMRVWRSGGELVDLNFERRNVEPKPGQFMTLIRLEGALEPGHYLVTAYGGEPLVWASGAGAQPFLLRLETWPSLDAGLFEGVIGPFGSLRFAAPASYDAFRLEAPQAAPLKLEARRGVSTMSASIAKNSREPAITLDLASDGKEPAKLEVSGYEGQAFSLRAAHRDAHFSFEGSGPHLVGLDTAGEGGDEIRATALFARVEKDGKTHVLASDTPRVANGRPWRGKFNLRGRASLLFEVVDAGPVAIDAKGVNARALIEPTLGALAPRADGKIPNRYDLAAGFYTLVLDPIGDAAGVVDVTLGTPGMAVAAPVQAPARVAISFGEQQLEKDGSYLILANVAPGLLVGPRIVALPADLAQAPLPLWQGADETISIPLRAPKNGKIVAHDDRGAEVAMAFGPETVENAIIVRSVKIAPSGKARALGLAFVAEPAAKTEEKEEAKDGADEEKHEEPAAAAKPSKPPPGRAPLIATQGRATYFDLARDETRELRFDVAQGGLFRVETLGRLQTAIKLGAAITTNLGAGDNNGPGHNGLVTTYLRAGAYRAAVTAKESSGRLGFLATPATLVETQKLVDEGSARATLAPGKGASVPLEITHDGLYTIDLLGVGRAWQARLEDSEGWPLSKPGKSRLLTRQFEKGSYRLVVSPEDVEARMVARLRRFAPTPELAGHGPHDLPFETPQKLQWREPQARGGAREPDVWRFSLHGDADISLSISDGMIAEIFRDKDSVGKAAAGRDFKSRLGAGDYHVEARAISRDDRLDYEISLKSKELQPGVPRFVVPPAKVSFALARDAVVDLTSFGEKERLGVLKDSGGAVVEQLTGNADDWNIALSRRLPAGAYTLELTTLGASPQSASGEGDEASADNGEPPVGDAENLTELRLALPAEIDEGALAASGSKTLTGAGAHVLALPAAPEGGLSLVLAQSSAEVALSVEMRVKDGDWSPLGLRRGLAPFAAWPAGKDAQWRAVVWTVGGGDAPIVVAAREVKRSEQSGERVVLE
ncbi:MAG: hypothetical protein WB816_03280, partial [Methylocystis sp.]